MFTNYLVHIRPVGHPDREPRALVSPHPPDSQHPGARADPGPDSALAGWYLVVGWVPRSAVAWRAVAQVASLRSAPRPRHSHRALGAPRGVVTDLGPSARTVPSWQTQPGHTPPRVRVPITRPLQASSFTCPCSLPSVFGCRRALSPASRPSPPARPSHRRRPRRRWSWRSG